MEQEVELGKPRTGPLTGVRVADFSAIFSGPSPALCWPIRVQTSSKLKRSVAI